MNRDQQTISAKTIAKTVLRIYGHLPTIAVPRWALQALLERLEALEGQAKSEPAQTQSEYLHSFTDKE